MQKLIENMCYMTKLTLSMMVFIQLVLSLRHPDTREFSHLTLLPCGESHCGFLPKSDSEEVTRAAEQSLDVSTERWKIALLLACISLHVLWTCWDSRWLTLLHVFALPLAAHIDVLHCAAFQPAALQSLLNRTFHVFGCHLHDSTGTDLRMVW